MKTASAFIKAGSFGATNPTRRARRMLGRGKGIDMPRVSKLELFVYLGASVISTIGFCLLLVLTVC
jgi:hypothetical protein